MKKVYFALLAAPLLLNSCITSMKTATTMDIHPSVRNVTVADLNVAPERITYRMVPSKAVQRGGIENVKQAAENEALQKNGNADILVEPQFVYSMKNGRVKSIEVTGRPAYYTNFRSLPDTVWSNPYFNGLSPVVAGGSNSKGLSLRNALGGVFGGKSSAEKEQKTKKVRNPYRSTGFHAYFDFNIGPTLRSGSADYFLPRNYDTNNGGYMLTLGAQIDEQLYLGVGAGALWVTDDSDYDYYIYNSEERALNNFFSSEWRKYSYAYVNEHEWKENELEREGTFIFDGNDATNLTFIPIYANARYYFSPKKVSPFVDLKLGFSKEVNKKSIDGGIYLSPSIGIGLRRLHIAFKYSMQGAGYSTRFKNEIDDFFNALNSSDSEQWESGSYVSYYDGYRNTTVSGDKRSNSEFLDLLNDFKSHTSWLFHNFSINIGIRF